MPTLVRTTAALRAHLPSLLAAPSIAVDTEFHPERTYFPKLMLIQLRAEGGDALLVDPLGDVDLRELTPVVREVPLVMHGGDTDLQILHRATGAVPALVFDTQIAAGCVGLGYPTRLQELVRTLLGRAIDKGETLSDWGRRPLSPEQVRYAAEDVLVLHALRAAIEVRLREHGNEEIAASCTAEAVSRALAAPDDAQVWRTLPASGGLTPEELPAIKRLAAWRESHAREADLPRHNVAPDWVLIDLARRRVTTKAGMLQNRRMPSGLVRAHGDELVACVIASTNDPVEATTSAPRAAVDAVRAAVRAASTARGVAAELVLAEDFSSRWAGGEQAAGWRQDALGAAFAAFLDRRAALTVDGSICYTQPTCDKL